eukprot:7675448-Lingulodinium_polyedra.AAC.1
MGRGRPARTRGSTSACIGAETSKMGARWPNHAATRHQNVVDDAAATRQNRPQNRHARPPES